MQKSIMKKILIIAVLAAGVAGIKVDESVFQASLTPDIAIHPKTTQSNGWFDNFPDKLARGFQIVNWSF